MARRELRLRGGGERERERELLLACTVLALYTQPMGLHSTYK